MQTRLRFAGAGLPFLRAGEPVGASRIDPYRELRPARSERFKRATARYFWAHFCSNFHVADSRTFARNQHAIFGQPIWVFFWSTSQEYQWGVPRRRPRQSACGRLAVRRRHRTATGAARLQSRVGWLYTTPWKHSGSPEALLPREIIMRNRLLTGIWVMAGLMITIGVKSEKTAWIFDVGDAVCEPLLGATGSL